MGANSRLIDLIQRAPRPRLAVVGDSILDMYIQGRTERISPEAPIQVLEVRDEHEVPGGAANVAANLARLGARVELCTLVGEDAPGTRLVTMMRDLGIGTRCIMTDPERPTTVKTRVVAQNQQLVRIDRERRRPASVTVRQALLDRLGEALEGIDAVVISDYAKGVVDSRLLSEIRSLTSAPVLVDPKGTDYGKYRGATLITPNRREAEQFTGFTLRSREDLRKAASLFFDRLDVDVVITLGSGGIYLSQRGGTDRLAPAEARSVYDVTGAGDTVIAMLGFCLGAGIPLDDAVPLANAAAGIVVGRLGAASPSREEIVRYLSGGTTYFSDKILTLEAAVERSRVIRDVGERLVFTNGCFDLIHRGHVSYFREAKRLGDYLMVAVNDDDSIRRLKGPHRPIMVLAERLEMLASLQVVDFVLPFSGDTPLETIEAVSPQVLVKGEDWRDKGVVGQEWVESHGGEVKLMSLAEGYSTTAIIQRILDRYGKGDER